MKRKLLSAIMFGAMIPLMFACEEKQEEQVVGPASLAIQGAGAEAVNYTLTDQSPSVTVSVRAEAARISGNVLSIGFKVDLSMVEAYNQAHGTDYQSLPAEAFEMTVPSVILPRYNTVSSTSELRVNGPDIPENGTYVLPVTFDSIEGEENFTIEENRDILYVLITKDFPEDAKIRTYTLSEVPQFSRKGMHALCWLPDGNLAVSTVAGDPEYPHSVATVNPSTGENSVLVNTYGANWPYGLAVSDGILYIGYKSVGEVGSFDLSGTVPGDQSTVISGLNQVLDCAVDADGNLYVLCRGDLWNNHGRIYKYPAGEISGSNADENLFVEFESRILCMEFDAAGDLIVYTAQGFYKVAKDGSSEPEYMFASGGGDVDGAALQAKFSDLYSFSLDPDGNMWIADFGAKKVKFVQKGEMEDYSDATVQTIVGEGTSLGALAGGPRGIIVSEDGTEIYFGDENRYALHKIKVTFE